VRRTAAVARTRAAIESAALELFERDGYESTHVTHVAEAAGVSRRTVFRHFPRKEDLVFSTADEDTSAVADALRHRPGDESPRQALAGALRDASPRFDRELTALRLRVVGTHALLMGRTALLRQQWIDAVSEALTDRGVDDARRARTLATVAIAVLGEAMRRWALEDAEERPLADHVEDAIADVQAAASA
jgi:AcrR family transcriptional regulator